jgi:Uma2 family endonuclease
MTHPTARPTRAARSEERYGPGMGPKHDLPSADLIDHRVFLRGVTWADYERLLEIRGEKSVPRMTYLEGTLELMSPSRHHEMIKILLSCLVETFCLERDIDFTGVGSWTIKREEEERGAEPDECYVFGPLPEEPLRPDLAIEVVWTSGGLDKLEVWKKLLVPEVWFWEDEALSVHRLRGGEYVEVPRSEWLPTLDLAHLLTFLDRPSTFAAIRDYRAALRTHDKS